MSVYEKIASTMISFGIYLILLGAVLSLFVGAGPDDDWRGPGPRKPIDEPPDDGEIISPKHEPETLSALVEKADHYP
jgi:hypothetical protein